MPYTHRKIGSEECVFKKDTNEKVGCTKSDINKYLAALHANADESVDKENIVEMKKDKISGGLSDNKTPKDIAKKFNVSLSKIKKQLEMGKKVEAEHTNSSSLAKEISTDHLIEIPDYYTRLDKMEKEAVKYWKTKEVVENTKDLIKNLIRENIGLYLTDESLETSKYHILNDQQKVGTIVIGRPNKNFGDNTLEIFVVYFNKDTTHLKLAEETIVKLFELFPNIQRILVQPKPESVDFWSKLNAQRMSDKYMIIFRGH